LLLAFVELHIRQLPVVVGDLEAEAGDTGWCRGGPCGAVLAREGPFVNLLEGTDLLQDERCRGHQRLPDVVAREAVGIEDADRQARLGKVGGGGGTTRTTTDDRDI